MRSSGYKDGYGQAKPLRFLCLAFLAGCLMSCKSLGIDGLNAARPVEPQTTMEFMPRASLIDRRSQLSEGFDRMRERIDGALEATKDSAGEIVRRARGRAIPASDACHSADEGEGCSIAAKSACVRASYSDGSPLSSMSYVACSGTWSLWAGDAPAGTCKTKRRLQAALCW